MATGPLMPANRHQKAFKALPPFFFVASVADNTTLLYSRDGSTPTAFTQYTYRTSQDSQHHLLEGGTTSPQCAAQLRVGHST